MKRIFAGQVIGRMLASRWVQVAALLLVFGLGFGIRLVDLTDPPLDFHPVRQIRSALIARSIYYQHAAEASPEMRSEAAALASLEDYEPPILEQIVGWTYVFTGSERVWYARVYNAIFWLVGGLAAFGLLRRSVSFPAALTGLLFYFCLPFGVIASRSFQPDSWMVMWILLTAWAVDSWAGKPSWKWALIAGLVGGLAILVKVVAAFFVLLILAFSAVNQLGWRKVFRSGQVWVTGLLMVLPTLLYYLLFLQERSASFLSFWVGALSWMVATTEFYADWLAMIKSLAGLMTLVVALVGITLADRRSRAWLAGGWMGYVLYGLVFPYQYVTHEYYHLPLVAIIGVSLPFAFQAFYQRLQNQPWVWRLGCAAVILFASFYSLYVSRSILVARDYRSEPAGWQSVGEAIPENASFIALTADYGMRLRYFGGRVGDNWPSTADLRLKELSSPEAYHFEAYFEQLAVGKDYFVVTSFSQFNEQADLKTFLTENYPVFIETDDFVIYSLK